MLAWARFMQLMLDRHARLHAAQRQQPAGAPIEEVTSSAQTAPPADSPRKQKPIRYPSKTNNNSLSVCLIMLLPSNENPARCLHRHLLQVFCMLSWLWEQSRTVSAACTEQICLVGTGVQGVRRPAKALQCPSWSPS